MECTYIFQHGVPEPSIDGAGRHFKCDPLPKGLDFKYDPLLVFQMQVSYSFNLRICQLSRLP